MSIPPLGWSTKPIDGKGSQPGSISAANLDDAIVTVLATAAKTMADFRAIVVK